jgi:predicted DNA-binding transcriptional regulator YafY
MRYDKTKKILELARALASSAEGLTLEEMCRVTGCGRRTVERMRDTIRSVFPQVEEIPDHPSKRFRIPKGLDGFFQDPTTEELSDLGVVIAEFREAGAKARVESLAQLDKKIRAAMRYGKRRTMETDVEALLRAELIAVQAGPRPTEDPAVLMTLRNALLGMKMLRFLYHGGSKPGTSREVVPYGIIFGRMNYLIGADAGSTNSNASTRQRRLLPILTLLNLPTLPSLISKASRKMWCCMFFRAGWKILRITASTQVRPSKRIPRAAPLCAFALVECSN